MFEIVTYENPELRKKSKPVLVKEIKSEEFQKLLPEMIETMHKKDGVGLAAPQIGINIRLITVKHKDGDLVMINPKITRKSLAKEWGEEGCLSVPCRYGEVNRHKKVWVTYLDPQACRKKLTAEGMLARIIQHEVDHLDGMLFIDKARNLVDINCDDKQD